mgnify:CR=1 FL=1
MEQEMATKLQEASIKIRQNKNKDTSPKWVGVEEWTSAEFTRHFYETLKWYRLEKSNKDLKPAVINWMAANDYTKSDIQAFKKTKDSRCGLTMGSIASCLLHGMPEVFQGFNNNKNAASWLREEIRNVIESGSDDRMRDAAGSMTEEVDSAIDSFIMNPDAFDPKAFKMVSLLRGKGAKAAHTRFIKSFYQNSLDELIELASGKADDQLKEGHKHLSRKNVKKLIEFYQSIVSACEQIAAEAKVLKKPRAKKIKPAEQIVAKLKFKTIDDNLGIVSVPAAGLIGAQAAVVFNTKTRKIGIYISKSSVGLSVKGTSIIDFSNKSFQKTVRKPADALKEFKDQNTQKRLETWFSKIKSTETVMNGRINADIVILKVFK